MATALPSGMQKRGRVYYSNFRHQGRKVRERLGTDRRTAEKKLTELRARLERGDYGLLDGDYPWDSLTADFLAWARQSKRESTAKDYAQNLAMFEQYAKPVSVREITHERILRFREWRFAQEGRGGEPITPRTINKQVGTIQTMLNKAVEWKHIGSNPIKGIEPLTHDEPKKERRPLEVEEVHALFDASVDYMLPVWRMFMTSGIREGELVGLLFSDIDFEHRLATVRAANSKSKKTREIPLDDETLEMLAKLRDEAKHRQPVKGLTPELTARQTANFSREHVFVTRANTPLKNNLLKRFYATCRRAGIEGAEPNGSVDIHSLRGSFITISIDNGASPKAVQEIVGHATLAMTMNAYAKANDRSKRDAVGKLPFATMSTPAHIVKMHEAGANRAQVESGATQPQAAKRIQAG